MGPTLPNGMGDGPLTFQEVTAFPEDLMGWEMRVLVGMSNAYIRGRENGKSLFSISPLIKTQQVDAQGE